MRLSSLQANKALLGYGWAAAELKNPKQALVPWTELAQRDPSDAAVLEARIAVPYAYAELGARGQALERYNEAIAAFDARERRRSTVDRLDPRRQAARPACSNATPAASMGWFWNIRALPAMPHAGHLAPAAGAA